MNNLTPAIDNQLNTTISPNVSLAHDSSMVALNFAKKMHQKYEKPNTPDHHASKILRMQTFLSKRINNNSYASSPVKNMLSQRES